MNYMDDLFQAQRKMYESFYDMYLPKGEKGEKAPLNPMEDMMDMQKKTFDFWKDNMNGEEGNPFAIYGEHGNPFLIYGKNIEYFNSMMEMQKKYFDNMNKFYKMDMEGGFKDFYNLDNINESFNKFKDFYSPYNFTDLLGPNVMKVMDKAYDANSYYLKMYEFWDELNTEFLNAAEIDSGKINKFMTEASDKSYKMMLNLVPEDYRIFLEQPKDLADKYLNVSANFYRPWGEDILKLRELFLEGSLENDTEKISEFFRLWKEKYDQTYGRLLNSPSMGTSKNIVDQQNRAFDRLVDMFIVSTAFSSKIMSVQRKAFQNITKEYMNLYQEGMQAKTFDEFYEFASGKIDKYMVEYFGSEEFSHLMGEFSSSVMDFKIETDKVIEEYLASTPLVTKAELDSTFKKVYDLKKEVRSLRKEVEELKETKAKAK